jgi:hypothetical protein
MHRSASISVFNYATTMGKQSTEEIGQNLKSIFGDPISTEEKSTSWCQLGSFLSDFEKVLEAMAKLDTLMFEKLCNKKGLDINGVENRLMVTQAYGAYHQKSTGVSLGVAFSKSDVTHLLSDLLTVNEEKFHFTTASGDTQAMGKITVNRTTPEDARKRVPTYHGFVQPDAFMGQLKKKSQWKDPGAQPTHGEYAHRLQWFAVTLGLWQSGTTASDVFESIGNYREQFDRGSGKAPQYLYLWDALCDRTNGVDVSFDDPEFLTSDGPGRGKDFRSPENLNMFLIDNDGDGPYRWPLLKIFLEARKNKRDIQFQASYKWNEKKKKGDPKWDDDPMYYFQASYLSKKLYGKSYEDVVNEEPKLEVIQKLLVNSDQIWKF